MKRAFAAASVSALVLALAVSCSSDPEGKTNDVATGGSSAAGAAGAPNGTGSSSNTGGASNTGGSASTGGAGGGQGGAEGGAGGVGGTPAAEGEPCPEGDECDDGLICVGYGNPLPNGESTACRLVCSPQDPPDGCDCTSGFCEPIPDPYVNGCEDMLVDDGCADASATTLDFYSPHYPGCGQWTDLGNGEGWVEYGQAQSNGFAVDQKSRLGFLVRSDAGTMTFDEAKTFCEGLTVQGLSDWRLPTVDEERLLAGGCSDTAPGGSCPISDSTCLDKACGLSDECTSCTWGAGPGLIGSYCRAEVTICFGGHTTSACPDCPTAGNWRYAAGNGNFYSAPTTDKTFPMCVMSNVPNAIPCAD